MMPFEILKNLGKNDSNTTSRKTNLKKKKKKKKQNIKKIDKFTKNPLVAIS